MQGQEVGNSGDSSFIENVATQIRGIIFLGESKSIESSDTLRKMRKNHAKNGAFQSFAMFFLQPILHWTEGKPAIHWTLAAAGRLQRFRSNSSE